MDIITLDKWINMFSNKNNNTISYETFMNKAIILKGNNEKIEIKSYIKEKYVNSLYLFYKNTIEHKNQYLQKWYINNLQVNEKFIYMNNKLSPQNYNNRTNGKYKNLIRNVYLIDILQNTTTIQKHIPSFLTVLINMFKYDIFDYKLLTPFVFEQILNNNLASMLSGIYFKASIMNPYMVNQIVLKEVIGKTKKDMICLTPTLGWSSYLIGILNIPNVKHYVGIDVIKNVCIKTEEIQKKYFPDKTCDIRCTPSEDLLDKKSFMKKYSNKIDFAFFSPPYYELELYRGTNQSTNKYQTYDKWLENYWRKTVKMCYKCLRTKGKFIYIIGDYKYKKITYNLVIDLKNIVESEKFHCISNYVIGNANIGFTKHRQYEEVILIFEK